MEHKIEIPESAKLEIVLYTFRGYSYNEVLRKRIENVDEGINLFLSHEGKMYEIKRFEGGRVFDSGIKAKVAPVKEIEQWLEDTNQAFDHPTRQMLRGNETAKNQITHGLMTHDGYPLVTYDYPIHLFDEKDNIELTTTAFANANELDKLK